MCLHGIVVTMFQTSERVYVNNSAESLDLTGLILRKFPSKEMGKGSQNLGVTFNTVFLLCPGVTVVLKFEQFSPIFRVLPFDQVTSKD